MSKGCGALLPSVAVVVSFWAGCMGHDDHVTKRFADAGEVLGHGVSVFFSLTGEVAAFSVLGVSEMAILSGDTLWQWWLERHSFLGAAPGEILGAFHW